MTYAIAIPAFNEAASIGRLLADLRTSTSDAVEILVADNASTDETTNVVHAAGAADSRVRLIDVPTPGKPAAWNALMNEIATEVVVFVDADVLPRRGSIAALVEALRDDDGLLAVGGRRTVVTADGDRLARFLADPVIETCLCGSLYALRRGPVLARLATDGDGSMPDVFAEDNWLLSRLRRGEFAVCDGATVEAVIADRAAQRKVSARRRLVAHEIDVAVPEIGTALDASHPQALRPWPQARHVAFGPYRVTRKARWFVGAAAKLLADAIWPVGTAAAEMIADYDSGAARLLRGATSTATKPRGPLGEVRIRPATPDDAAVYARLENEAAGGGTRRLYGGHWPDAVETEFRVDRTRHGFGSVLCAEADGRVVGMAALVEHERWVDESPPRRRARAFELWRRRLGLRPTPVTMAGEVSGATIAVDEGARGQGVGTMLHHACVARANEVSASAIVHETAHDNDAALALNRGLGFAELVTRLPEPSTLMVKPLTPEAELRVAWHHQFHGGGLVHDSGVLVDTSPLPALCSDVNRFEAAVAAAERAGRAEVPYFFTAGIERVAFDPAIVEIVEAVLRTDEWVVWGPNVRRDTPNEGDRWHVDLESCYWPSVTVAVGVDGCVSEAATWFLPGTARINHMPAWARAVTDDGAVRALAAANGHHDAPRQPAGFGDGRFYVFDAKTWHRGDRAAAAGGTRLFLHYQSACDRRVPTMVDHARHVWSRVPAPYLTNRGVAENSRVAATPTRERIRRADAWRRR